MAVDMTPAMEKLNSWLNMLIEVEGADLHIKTDSSIRARVKDDIVMLSTEEPATEIMDGIIRGLVVMIMRISWRPKSVTGPIHSMMITVSGLTFSYI